MNFNIRSIGRNFEEFCTYLSNYRTKIDIIILTETWLTDKHNIKDFEINGYHSPIVQNRESKSGGGVLIYLHERFNQFHIRKDLSFKDEFNHCLTVEYTNNKKKNLITACYRSPSDDNNIETFLRNLEGVLQKCKFSSTIAGDMNLNLINYQHHQKTNDYYNLLISNSYQPMITNPTRITDHTATLIDHIWTNNLESERNSSYILVTDISDHLPCIFIEHDSNRSTNSAKYVKYRPITDKNREYFIRNVKKTEMALKFHTTNSNTSTQTKYSDYFAHLNRLYATSFPTKPKKIHHKYLSKPWIDTELQRLIKKKNRLFSKKTKTNTASASQNYRDCKNELAQKLKKAKTEYYHKKLYQETSTLKQKWDCLRELINRCKSSTDFCPIDNQQLGEHYSLGQTKFERN